MVILICEGEPVVCVGKLCEGEYYISSHYEINATKRFTKHCSSCHYLINIPFIATLFTASTGSIHFGTSIDKHVFAYN